MKVLKENVKINEPIIINTDSISEDFTIQCSKLVKDEIIKSDYVTDFTNEEDILKDDNVLVSEEGITLQNNNNLTFVKNDDNVYECIIDKSNTKLII